MDGPVVGGSRPSFGNKGMCVIALYYVCTMFHWMGKIYYCAFMPLSLRVEGLKPVLSTLSGQPL